MKKQLSYIVLSLCGLSMSSQVNRFDQSAPSHPYVNTSTYVSPNWAALKEIGDAMEAKYQNNLKFRSSLMDWILEIKSKSDDKILITSLNCYYDKLKQISNDEVPNSKYKLDEIHQYIKEELVASNTRTKELPNKLWESGNANFKNENYSQAILDYTNLIQLNPNFSYVYRNRAEAYLNKGKFPLTLTDLNKYIEMKNDDAFAFSSRGWAKYHLNDLMGALADFNKQIELEPNSAYAYYNRGSAKSELNDNYGAISDYTKSIELKPDYSMAWNNRGWAKYKLKKFTDALKDLNKSIELDQSNWVAYDSRQETKFALNDFKGCIEDCNNAILINSKCDNSYFFKGRAYYKQGNKTKACEDWSKAGELGKVEAYDYINKYCK